MKFVVTRKPRFGGSAAENEVGVARVLAVYGKGARLLTPRCTSSSCGPTEKEASLPPAPPTPRAWP